MSFRDTEGVPVEEILLHRLLPSKYLRGSTITVVYDTYSSAWQIPLLLLKESLETGSFGVVSNYSLPIGSLVRKANALGLDIEGGLAERKLAIIDLFGTRYSPIRLEMPNLLYLDKVEPETINPKIERIYSTRLAELIKGQVIRLIYTLDGAALMLGEENTLKLLNQALAHVNLKLSSSTLLLALNSDVVSKRFVAWVTEVSDVLLLARSYISEGSVKEYLYVLSAPYGDFEPAVYRLKVTGEKGMGRFKVEKVGSAPELGPSAEE